MKIYESSLSIIERNGRLCSKSYKKDTKDKKLTKEFCVCSCLRKLGLNVMCVINLDLQKHKIIMPFLKNGDMFKNILKFDIDQINFIFKQLVETVDKLHDSGVSHRDIKLENIMIDNDYKVILCDFGECEIFRLPWESIIHKIHGIVGTAEYIAPEEYTEQDFCPIKIDIWALGIFYYIMLKRKYPWQRANYMDIEFCNFVYDKDRFLKGMPGIFKKILEVNPEKRITTKEIIKDVWFNSILEVPLY